MGKVRDTLVIGSLVFTVPLIWWSWTSTPSEPEMTASEKLESGARLACRSFISDSLKDPSSAEWGIGSGNFYAAWPAQSDENGSVTVRPQFRAKNGFGALDLSQWNCEVQLNGDSWQLVRLNELS